jgi:spore maturation protein CgeB
MRNAGYSPSVRLFEAAACGVPIISDWWEGLDSTFTIGKEVLVAEGAADVMHFLHDFPDYERLTIAFAARKRVLSEHTSKARAIQLEAYWKEMNDRLTPCSPRRHRRDREGASRLEAWLEPESDRQSSSDSSRAEVIGLAYTSDLHQSGSKSG